MKQIDFTAECAEDVVSAIAEIRDWQDRLAALRKDLARHDADVTIDAITLAALEGSGVAPKAASRDLRESNIRIIDTDTRHGKLVLYVRHGVVTGNVPLGNGMRWQEGRLAIPKAQAISLKNVKGKRLDRLVPHEFVGPRLKVNSGSEIGGSSVDGARTHPGASALFADFATRCPVRNELDANSQRHGPPYKRATRRG